MLCSMESPKEPIASGSEEPRPPVFLTPQQEEQKRRVAKHFKEGQERLREKVAEAERLGVPLHDLLPVN